MTYEYAKVTEPSTAHRGRGGRVQLMIVVFRSPYERHKSARWMPRPRTAMKDATNLRKASGRRFVACNPKISEWGNPPAMSWNPRGNACVKLTRGSETSQYPEEKRTIRVVFCPDELCSEGWNATLVIPQVAASEKGKAQTDFFGGRGCKMRTSYLYEKS